MAVLVNSMVDVFENTKDCIYGKYHEGPFVIFLPADFKSNTMVYKNMNSQFDLRGKLKEKFRYFGDIYEFNSRTCDCLFTKIKNNGYIHRVFTVIYKPTFKDETKMENVINGLKRLKVYN